MKKELQLFNVEEQIGFNQDLFKDWWMNKGGCGAVTACDCCIYFKKYFGMTHLFPFDTDNITKKEYEEFAMTMKPFLSPRFSGINKLEIFADGFADYLKSVSDKKIKMNFLYSDCAYKVFSDEIKRLIDNNMPVPVLVLKHKAPVMKDFVWHWFWIAGYEEFDGVCMVKIITYGTYFMLPLYELWDSGYSEKGGIIRLRFAEEGEE